MFCTCLAEYSYLTSLTEQNAVSREYRGAYDEKWSKFSSHGDCLKNQHKVVLLSGCLMSLTCGVISVIMSL